jgi:hypothetical protein
MNMTILISESQKHHLLLESSGGKINDVIKENYELVKKIIKTSSKQLNTDLTFLITWGASIGGMVGPINEFVQGKYPELNDIEISLLLTGVIATYYFDNKKLMSQLYAKLTEGNLFEKFLNVIKKCDELRDSFLNFVNSLGLTLHKVTNMMSYTFIIPVLPLLYNIAMNGDVTDKEISEIILRVSSFGLVAVSGVIAKELVSKIVRRFRSK